MHKQSDFAVVNGTRLYYEVTGSGDTVVFIHGFGADSRVWDAQFDAFAAGYQVVRYDLRGFGKSALPTDQDYSHSDDLRALLSHLRIPRAHLIGHSLGGGIAIDFALTFPESTNRLVLADSSLGGFHWSEEWSRSWEPIFTEAAAIGLKAALPRLLKHPLFAPACERAKVKSRLAQILGDYSGWHAVNTDLAHSLNPPAIERLNQIRSATLIILGERDLPDNHMISDILSHNIPKVDMAVLTGIGHVSPMEAPDQFSKVALSFLSRT